MDSRFIGLPRCVVQVTCEYFVGKRAFFKSLTVVSDLKVLCSNCSDAPLWITKLNNLASFPRPEDRSMMDSFSSGAGYGLSALTACWPLTLLM